MAKDLWNSVDDDETFDGTTYEQPDFKIIPEGTEASTCITKAEWGTGKNFTTQNEDEDHIAVFYKIEDGEYKNRVIFKKYWVESPDTDQQAKAHYELLTLDAFVNGGKIRALKRKPENEELSRLVGKSVTIEIGMMEGKKGQKDMNFLREIKKGKPGTTTKTKPKDEKVGFDDPDDVPF